jgi:hypothetical protein
VVAHHRPRQKTMTLEFTTPEAIPGGTVFASDAFPEPGTTF